MSNPLSPSWLSKPDDANALREGVWPGSAVRNTEGELVFGGVPASELISAYGSPAYVVDQEELELRAKHFHNIVTRACERNATVGHVYYASKALITGHVVQWVSGQGLGFDVASGGEMAIALAGGAPASSL